MEFDLSRAIQVLQRTPAVLQQMLGGLDDAWTGQNEGENTWSAYDVVGHLIHGEKTDWMTRLNIIMSDGPEKTFAPFDRFAQFEESKGKTMAMLLTEFAELRGENITRLQGIGLEEVDFIRTGIHPAFGEVTLVNLLSTWTVHDLAHINQISRVMAKQWKEAVGPWYAYLPVLQR